MATPWWVDGGWAIDLFLSEQTRSHDDVEIAVPRAGVAEIRAALPEFAVDVVGSGHIWPFDGPAFDAVHQTWFRDTVTGVYRLDVFREPHDGQTWICRRNESIRAPFTQIRRYTPDGIPYLAPEVVLPFKAKATRPKDEADFARTLPRLGDERDWLQDALERAHPDHAWIAEL